MEDIELLIREAHQRNLRVILDIALNHTSAQVSWNNISSETISVNQCSKHEWFQTSRRARKDPNLGKRDWYFWSQGKLDEHGNRVPPNNWESTFTGARSTDSTSGSSLHTDPFHGRFGLGIRRNSG